MKGKIFAMKPTQRNFAIGAFAALFIVACFSNFSARPYVPLPREGNSDTSGHILRLKANLDNKYYMDAAGRKQVYMYITVNAGKVKQTVERAPVNVALVLDRSGSMKGDKIVNARKAADFVIDNLNKRDNLSIVCYDEVVDVLSPSSPVTDKDRLKALVNNITDRGSTNLGGGLMAGYSQVKHNFQKDAVNRVLLLTDGLANIGITDSSILKRLAKTTNLDSSVSLSTFGVGADYNEDLLTDMARNGSGNYYFIESGDKIPSIFAQEIKGLSAVVAHNAKITVKFPSKYFTPSKAFGKPYTVNGDEMTIDLKDVISEEQKSILVKFDVVQGIKESVEFTSTLSYDDAFTNKKESEQQVMTLKPTSQEKDYKTGANIEVQQSIVLYESNEEMDQAMKLVDKGQYDDAKKMLLGCLQKMETTLKDLPASEAVTVQFKSIDFYNKSIDSVKNVSKTSQLYFQKSNKCSNYIMTK